MWQLQRRLLVQNLEEEMDDMNETPIKNRSISACLKAACVFFGKNIKTIIYKVWIPAAMVALLLATFSVYDLPAHAPERESLAATLTYYGIETLFVFLASLSFVQFIASLASVANQQSLKYNLVRSFKLFFPLAAISLLVFGGIFAGWLWAVLSHGAALLNDNADFPILPTVVALAASIVAVVILWVPASYLAAKYLCSPSVVLRKEWQKLYIGGWKHMGVLLSTLFITLVISALCLGVIHLPVCILWIAREFSNFNIANGDPSALPGYFIPLQFVACAVACFLGLFVVAGQFFVLLYTYGSIEAKEQERISLQQ